MTPTTPGTHTPVNIGFGVTLGRSTFGYATQDMLQATVALGGTHLYLQQVSARLVARARHRLSLRPGVGGRRSSGAKG